MTPIIAMNLRAAQAAQRAHVLRLAGKLALGGIVAGVIIHVAADTWAGLPLVLAQYQAEVLR